MKNTQQILLVLATPVLLALAFPFPGFWPLAYVGLIPLLFWLRDAPFGRAFLGGMFAGLIFYMIVFSWFASLTYWAGGVALLGVFLLFLVLSLFWGLLAVGTRFINKWLPACSLPAFPFMWVLMEYVDNHIMTGFGWGSLGYTQWNNLWVAQLASFGSVYAASFYVVLMNVLFYGFFRNIRKPSHAALLAAPLGIAAIIVPLWGKLQMREPDMSSSLRIGMIQPNFSLDVKWNREYRTHMLEVQERLTELVTRKGVDLVVWPESALYRCLIDEREAITAIVRKHNVFLLTGSNHYETTGSPSDEEIRFYNSAFLVDPEGRLLERYDKRHLAPFGEYVPLEWLLPFVGKIVPLISDFSPGNRVTIFQLGEKRFAVLICFENSFPHVVRDAGKLNVDFLVQLTNDGWFGHTAQPKQDMAIAVFRAIENGVALVRCTNTGISCFVDPWGRISGIVDSMGDTVFVRGFSVETISTAPHDTFYKRHGDLWALACAMLAVIIIGVATYRRSTARDSRGETPA